MSNPMTDPPSGFTPEQKERIFDILQTPARGGEKTAAQVIAELTAERDRLRNDLQAEREAVSRLSSFINYTYDHTTLLDSKAAVAMIRIQEHPVASASLWTSSAVRKAAEGASQ